MRTIVIESPFQGGTEREADNRAYLKRCIADALKRGEAPFASHAIYPGILDDTVADERTLGIQAGFAIAAKLDAWVFYLDRGVTPGMFEGVDAAVQAGFRPFHVPMNMTGALYEPYERPIVFRTFDRSVTGYLDASGSEEIRLSQCVRWPLLLARFEQHARQNWDLPR